MIGRKHQKILNNLQREIFFGMFIIYLLKCFTKSKKVEIYKFGKIITKCVQKPNQTYDKNNKKIEKPKITLEDGIHTMKIIQMQRNLVTSEEKLNFERQNFSYNTCKKKNRRE